MGKRRFLPKKMQGVSVLFPVRLGQGTQGIFDDPDDEWPEGRVTSDVPQPARETSPGPGPRGGFYVEAEDDTANQNLSPEEERRQRFAKYQASRIEGRTKQASPRKVEPPPKLTPGEEEVMKILGSEIKSRNDLMENLVRLRWLLESSEGKNAVNVKGPDGCTPLMAAARRGNLDFCVVLLRAGAPDGIAAAEAAQWKPCRALIRALAGDGYEKEDCQSALNKLQPEMRRMAEELMRKAAARALLEDLGSSPSEQRQRSPSPPPEPKPRRKGAAFKVVCDEVPINEEASQSSEELTVLVRDEVIEVFGYDRTRNWARVKIELPHGTESGWVQIQNDVKGELIRPVR